MMETETSLGNIKKVDKSFAYDSISTITSRQTANL